MIMILLPRSADKKAWWQRSFKTFCPIMNLVRGWVSVTYLSTDGFLIHVFPGLFFEFFQVGKINMISLQDSFELNDLFFFDMLFLSQRVNVLGDRTEFFFAKF